MDVALVTQRIMNATQSGHHTSFRMKRFNYLVVPIRQSASVIRQIHSDAFKKARLQLHSNNSLSTTVKKFHYYGTAV